MSASQQPGWPKFKYLTNEVGGNLTKTRTMGLDASGKIHSLGYKTALIIETDTNKDTIVRKPCDTKGYIGTVDASDGYTYYMPAYSTTIPKLNRETGELTYDEKFPSIPQIRSGAEGNNGIIYMPTYTKTLKIITLDTATGEVNTITPEKPTRNSFPACNHIWGAAADKKGEIYMPQVLGTNVAKIDKNGIFKYLEGAPVTSGVSGWTHKYIGAIYVEAVDKVFCLPRCGKRILVINCADDSYVEVNLPEDYLKVANKNKNFYGFLAPDGWVYSAFWADTLCFRINPKTLEIQWKDYTEDFTNGAANVKEGSGIMSLGTGYSTAALVTDDNVYLGLAGTNKAVKLEYDDSKVSCITESIVISNTSSPTPSSSVVICNTSCPSSSSSIVCNTSCPTVTCNVSCASSTITCNTSCPSPSSTPSVVCCSFPSPSRVTCCSSPSSCCNICSSPSASSCCNTCTEDICAVIIPTPSPSQPKSSYCYVGSSCCTQDCGTSIWSRFICGFKKGFCNCKK